MRELIEEAKLLLEEAAEEKKYEECTEGVYEHFFPTATFLYPLDQPSLAPFLEKVAEAVRQHGGEARVISSDQMGNYPLLIAPKKFSPTIVIPDTLEECSQVNEKKKLWGALKQALNL